MKFKFVIFISACFAILLVSCKKQNFSEANKLHGKWILVGIYDKYGVSGNNGWHNVSGDELQQIEFTVNGTYRKTDRSSGRMQNCSGTYRIRGRNEVEITSVCEPAIERFTISELTDESLITDFLGTEGIIRYKYKANR